MKKSDDQTDECYHTRNIKHNAIIIRVISHKEYFNVKLPNSLSIESRFNCNW